jgi:predicted amidohydrolase
MKFKLALCQIKGGFDKSKSRDAAGAAVRFAAAAGARVAALPEIWNCPYANKYFREYSESDGGETVQFMSALAREAGVWLVGGSIPEACGGSLYNTSYIFSPSGEIIGKHRKIHLFDVRIKGGINFIESESLTPGDRRTVVETEFGKIGVAICYDVRFPALFSAMADDGAKLIILPAAFNMTTGPAHWEILMRSRALDNQVYFAACSPARDLSAPYQAYGHSCVANPWGEFCGKADSQESVLLADIDLDYLESVREQMPTRAQRRPDVL